MLCKFQLWGILLIWLIVGQGSKCRMGVIGVGEATLSSILSPSLWEGGLTEILLTGTLNYNTNKHSKNM